MNRWFQALLLEVSLVSRNEHRSSATRSAGIFDMSSAGPPIGCQRHFEFNRSVESPKIVSQRAHGEVDIVVLNQLVYHHTP